MGNPRGIPYTKRMAEILMGYSGAYTYYRSYVGAGEGLAGGRMLTLIESHYNTLKSGISFGSLSCKAIADARPYLAATTTSSDEAVFTKPGTDTRYLHARFAIEERDIRDISSVFITGVLDLMRYVEDNWELLVRDIERGTIDASTQMPADVRAGLEARIKPNPERAAELRAIFERGFDEPITPAMWPNLLVVRSVAGGGFAPYTQRLRRFIGNDVHILYTGYSASEGAFSVPFQLDDPSSVLLQLLMGFTRLDNAPQLGIVAIVGMSVCDVIFNLVAVCVLDLGLRGMGLATALAYRVAVGICCTHFPSKRNTLHLVNPVPHVGQLAGVLKTGLPDSLIRATVMVRTFTFNWLLLTVASAGAVAALSMLSSVNSFASSATIGVVRKPRLDGRRSYLVPLAVEEMAANAVEHGFAKTKHPAIDVKLILKRDGTLVLRMRDNGAAFNPMDLDLSAADPCSAVGIRMLRQGMREVEYQNTVGLNNVVVTLPAASQ